MSRRALFVLLAMTASAICHAESPFYDRLIEEMSAMNDEFIAVRTQYGVDFNTKTTFMNSRGRVEPVTHIQVEGPLKSDKIQNLNDAANFTAHLVRNEVDSEYQTNDMIYPGLGAAIVDINGTPVAMMDYKMSTEPNTYCHRALIYTDKGFYSYAIIQHNATPGAKFGLYLVALVVASVNSGLL